MRDIRTQLTQQVLAQRTVSRVDVVRAKAFVMRSRGFTLDVHELVTAWATENAVREPERVDGSDSESIRSAGRYLALRLSVIYAVHELLVSAALVPGPGAFSGDLTIGYQHNNERGGLQFPEGVSLPGRVQRRVDGVGPLVDGDLFVAGTGLALDARIAKALGQAADCFGRDLLIPALAMLDAASEGMWSMTGDAVLAALPAHSGAAELGKRVGGKGSLYHLIRAVRAVVESTEGLSALGLAQNRDDVLNRLVLTTDWSDLVRKSRNELHWNAKQATPPNDSDKVAQLMMSVGERFAVLDTIQRMASRR